MGTSWSPPAALCPRRPRFNPRPTNSEELAYCLIPVGGWLADISSTWHPGTPPRTRRQVGSPCTVLYCASTMCINARHRSWQIP